MAKLCTLLIAALLINFVLSYAARPEPAALPLIHHEVCLISFLLSILFTSRVVWILIFATMFFFVLPNPILISFFCASYLYVNWYCTDKGISFLFMQEVEAEKVDNNDENCEGVGKEECLMRRTLAAHVDYIYTQNHKP